MEEAKTLGLHAAEHTVQVVICVRSTSQRSLGFMIVTSSVVHEQWLHRGQSCCIAEIILSAGNQVRR